MIVLLLFLPAAEMQFPAPAAFTLTPVAVRHGGSPRPVRRALGPLAAPQHIARVTPKFHVPPVGVVVFPGGGLCAVGDNRAGTLHL